MKLTLEKKVLAGFVACASILLIVGIISFRNSRQFIETSASVTRTHEVLYEFEQILSTTIDAESAARGYTITGDERYLEPFNLARTKLGEHISKTRELTGGRTVQTANLDQLEGLLKLRMNNMENYIQARRIRGFEEARDLILSGEGKRLQDEIKKIIDTARQRELGILSDRLKATEETSEAFSQLFVALLVIVAATLVIVYLIIIANINALKRAEAGTAEKNWYLTGSGALAAVMQGNKPVAELSRSILDFLSGYLRVHIGGIYLADETQQRLLRTASYGLGNDSPKTEISFGQGIVGECAKKGTLVLLDNLPDNYLVIDTGFGKVLPKSIIAIPFSFENRVTGVIELGTMNRFTERDAEFLKLVAGSIAIAVTSARAREKTRELLEETQHQAQELEAQQHELRQTNEELHTKSELLERSETELKAQQSELQKVNVELEEKANLLEEQKRHLEDAKYAIENKAREVEATSKYKSEFLANMSHELRTPLNSILILAQLLSENKNDRLGEKEIEYARNIHNSGSDLLQLINEILDLSKIESGKMELEISDVQIETIVSETSSMFSEVASSKGIDFRIEVTEEDRNSIIATDKQRLQQILRNLLSNAFKFTDTGGSVTLAVGPPAANVAFKSSTLANAPAVMAFSVTDTGIGIPLSRQELVFEAFRQADGSTKRKYGGTGLGLSISRELASALGGEIQLESAEGRGSRFTLLLPKRFGRMEVSRANADAEPERSTNDHSPIRLIADSSSGLQIIDDRDNIKENDRVILIIEDELPFANLLLDFVRARDYKGVIATQGNTGISFARHYRPDAILLDMKLPVMDGSEVLRQIKNDPDLRHIPVQIISSYERKKEGLELGAFDYLHKPVTTSDLQKAFDRLVAFKNKPLKKLLVVEDNRQQNQAIADLIGNGDVTCYSAYKGAEAFDMLSRDAFDCVIVDLGLPDMSGYELLERIRADEKLRRIPVIVYTGKDLRKEDTARLQRLADTVVLKTADSHDRLLDETILFLHRVESRLPEEKRKRIRKLRKADDILKNRKILIVDDDIRNIYSLTNALEEQSVRCVTAENGREALRALNDDPSIELVLMDVMMPEMDGLETTAEIRKLDKFRKLPIIALTAKAMKGDKEKCLAAGMSDYISKPVDLTKLLSLLRVWLYQ